MNIHLFLITGLFGAILSCFPAFAQDSEHEDKLTDSSLQLVAISPAVADENRVILEGPPKLSFVLSSDSRSIRITAADGQLVTVPPDIIRLSDVKSVIGDNGEASTILTFPVPVSLKSTENGDGRYLYEIKGSLAVRSWGEIMGGIDPIAEIVRPRTSTVLGDAFRAIGTFVDVSAGVWFEEPKLSDDELIRRLSAEVVRLRTELETAQANKRQGQALYKIEGERR